jgi:ADP-ribosylglycohydrolase
MDDPGELATHLWHELAQRREEGFDVAPFERRWQALGLPPLRVHRPVPDEHRATVEREAAELEALYRDLEALPEQAPGSPYDEPTDLGAILAARPDGPRRLAGAPTGDALLDRLHGAWLGRAAGCLLGKPVENWSRAAIREVLEYAREYPLRGYFPRLPRSPEGSRSGSAGALTPPDGARAGAEVPPSVAQLALRPETWFAGHIDRMVRDDDMDYPLIALHLLETYGPGYATADVGRVWLTKLPYLLVYTAERAAYRNLVLGLRPPRTATYRNPYREWIGAQIRADLWGWVCPGQPEQAAELAYRDAALSHVKNGIYGEMFFAAAIAAAFATGSIEEALRVGLTEVPARSRFAEAVRQTMAWVAEDGDFQRTTDRIGAAYGHYHSVHTLNNAALVVMGLLYAERGAAGRSQGGSRGDGDLLGPAICLTVMGGWDADCTGATAGSLAGTFLGARALPGAWVEPFHDRLESIVVGMTDNRFTDLARRTLAQAARLEAERPERAETPA